MTTTVSQTVFSPWLTPVRLVSTSNISGTYNNGPSNDGVGATLTVAASSLTIDSVAVEVGDRVLLQTQTTTSQQGVYVVNSIGSTVVLQRSGDMQSSSQLSAGQYMSVGAGSISAGNFYSVVEPLPNVIGVDAIVINSDPSAGGVSFSGPASTANSLVVFSNVSGDVKAMSATAVIANGITISAGNLTLSSGALTASGAIQSTTDNITAGSSGDAGKFISYPATAANGTFIFEALNAGGAFDTTLRNSVMGQSSVVSIPDPGAATANFILSAKSGTQSITSGSLQVSAGNLTAGSSGNAGTVSSFPTTALKGSLKLAAVDNTGDTVTTISNAAMGQASVVSIPDPGAATANFILNKSSGTQSISSGSFQVSAGNIIAGSSGSAGTLSSFPTTASKGSLKIAAVDNTGDTLTTISNAAMGQASVISITDPGAATANFILSKSAGTQNITTGALQVDAGAISSGLSAGGFVGLLKAFSTTATSGFIALQAAVNGSGDFGTTISNATTQGQAQVVTIPNASAATANFIISNASGTQSIATGSLQLTAGNLTAGSSGSAGTVSSFSSTASRGSLKLAAVANTGDTLTTISNAAMGQASVVSIPDPGAATANFLLDAGSANILAMQQFVGISNVLSFGTGTWTVTRIAQGNYVSRHTAGDETSIIGIDITPEIRVAASKGFRLDSFDYIYSIGTLAMDAHSATLDRIAYANNVAVSITSIPITVTLATATQANPYVTNATVDTPAFDITADSKYIIEVTANNSATSAYDFYGVMLRFSKTIG